MNRKAYPNVALIFAVSVLLALIFLTDCGTTTPVKSVAATPNVTPVTFSSQSAAVGTAFAAPLAATVASGQTPMSGAAVTFTAPTTGASGTFANGTNTETDMTNANGVATSTAFTANTTVGGPYMVTATVSGGATAADFSLTNTADLVTSTTGPSQSAAINTAFVAPLAATVVSGQNPVSGAAVTFTAPTTGASGTFVNGTNTETDTTNANGVATSTTFTANAIIGGPYVVTATVSGGATADDFSLTNTAALVTTSNFSFYLSGLETINRGPHFYALAGSVSVDSTGVVVNGEQDYNDARGISSPQPSGDIILGGALREDPTTGQGTLVLVTNNAKLGVDGTEILGVQFVNSNHALIIQFDGTATSSGSMDTQTLPSTLSGGYAFTLSGVDTGYNPFVLGGVFSISGATLQNGLFDINDETDNDNDNAEHAEFVTSGTAFTGTVSAPDSFGRGMITGTALGGISGITLNYYVVGPEAIRIIAVDANDSSCGSAYGQGSGTFSDASLGSSVFGVEGNPWGFNYAAAGQFTVPTSGTLQGVDDNDEEGEISSASPITGTYSIPSNGYGRLTILKNIGGPGLDAVPEPEGKGGVSVLGIYMTDPALNLSDPNNTVTGLGGALVVDLDERLTGTGVIIPQTDTSTASFAGNYAFGARDFSEGKFWEFDFIGQGSVTAGALAGTGLVSDPGGFFAKAGTHTGVTFSGIATPDAINLGRYTIPLAVTLLGSDPDDLALVIYQASGGELLLIDESENGMSLGSFEQQGSLTGMPALKGTELKVKAETQK
jgi:hypothetical protein